MLNVNKMASELVARLGKPAEAGAEEGTGDEGFEAAATALLEGIKRGDQREVASALRSFVEQCRAAPAEPESDLPTED